MTSVPFAGTKEQETRLLHLIEQLKSIPGPLMPILQGAQEIYGYLPIEVQTIISNETGIPMAEIYGVVTFYTQFSLNPKGKFNVSVCMGTACYVKGAGDVFEECKKILGINDGGCTADGKFSLEATRCLGCCGLAPVMMINEDVYGGLQKNDLKDIFKKY